MLLIEEKSLNEVYELYILSNLKMNFKSWTFAIIETQLRIRLTKTFKKYLENLNKFHAEYPYFKLKNASTPIKKGETIRKHL